MIAGPLAITAIELVWWVAVALVAHNRAAQHLKTSEKLEVV
jgi:hypothetical protein